MATLIIDMVCCCIGLAGAVIVSYKLRKYVVRGKK